MAASDAIRDLLPSLWRPEPDGRGLLADVIAASGLSLDLARVDGGNTMQAHWSRFSDYAPIAPYVSAFRREAGLPVLLPNDPDVDAHPYIDDLARLAGLLALVPYTDPTSSRETVEDFRRRVLGTVALWRDGVSTRAAIARAARLALSGTQERAVNVEEFAPGTVLSRNAEPRGIPEGLVGPLMRWAVGSESLSPVAPEIYITGATPVEGRIDLAENPMIERFSPATGTGTAILYDGTVEPGQTLALRPSHSSWLARDGGIQVATSLPADKPANPTASGPWTASAGAPAGQVMDIVQGADGALWACVNDADVGQLWRFDGSAWSQEIAGLPVLHCLMAIGQDVLVGHASGLSRWSVFGAPLVLQPDPAGMSDASVTDLAKGADGTIWVSTATGAATLGAADTLIPVGPGARAETETPLSCVVAEDDRTVYFGGDLGIFRFDQSSDAWHFFAGDSLDEGTLDWREWDPAVDTLPTNADVFLPAVTSLARGPDTLLWIGTEQGLAAWGAFRIRNTYATRLRAFPALGTGRINALAVDARQRIWAGTDRGLWVHDGLDWFEATDNLVRLPRLDAEDMGSGWRYDRNGSDWQFTQATGSVGFTPTTPAVVTNDNPEVLAIAWTDGAVAQLGDLVDGVFVVDEGAIPAGLRLRVKPTPDRIVDGGIAAIPLLDPGETDWRYLRLEEDTPPTPTAFPAWTREGRLLTPPSENTAPIEGRFLVDEAKASLDQVFAFNPSATVQMRWQPKAPFSITVRLDQPDSEETLPGAVIDRVYDAVDMVRPAGARVRLALGETVLKGNTDG